MSSYDSKVQVRGGNIFRAPAPKSGVDDLLSNTARVLERAGHDAEREKQKELALKRQTAYTESSNALMVKQAEIEERVKRGEFDGAIEEYSDFYDKQMTNLANAFGQDKEAFQQVKNRMSRLSTTRMLKLKSQVSSARNQQALNTTENLAQTMRNNFLTAPQNEEQSYLGMLEEQYQQLYAAGVMSQDEAMASMQEQRRAMIGDKASLLAEKNDYASAVNVLDRYKDQLDPLEYQEERSALIDQYEKMNKDRNDVASGIATKSQIDDVFTETMRQNPDMGFLEMSDYIGKISGVNGRVPTSIKNKVNLAFSKEPDQITEEDAGSISSLAQLVDSLPANAKDNMGEKDVVKAKFITQMIRDGADFRSAYTLATKAADEDALDPDVEKDLQKEFGDRTEGGGLFSLVSRPVGAVVGGVKSFFGFDTSDTNIGSAPIPPTYKTEIMRKARMYARMGRDADEAMEMATDELRDMSGVIRGNVVPYAPNKIFRNIDNDKMDSLIEGALGDGEFIISDDRTFSKARAGDKFGTSWPIATKKTILVGDEEMDIVSMTGERLQFTEDEINNLSSESSTARNIYEAISEFIGAKEPMVDGEVVRPDLIGEGGK